MRVAAGIAMAVLLAALAVTPARARTSNPASTFEQANALLSLIHI